MRLESKLRIFRTTNPAQYTVGIDGSLKDIRVPEINPQMDLDTCPFGRSPNFHLPHPDCAWRPNHPRTSPRGLSSEAFVTPIPKTKRKRKTRHCVRMPFPAKAPVRRQREFHAVYDLRPRYQHVHCAHHQIFLIQSSQVELGPC
jgi:hypothetical protein